MARDAFWPRGGWSRAASYAKHRLGRLPDPPERIGRGLAAGVLAAFTPLFGLHFIAAAVFAKIARGNIVAALLGTFLVNPLTLPVIALLSVELGHYLLGTGMEGGEPASILKAFAGAWGDLWYNLRAVFTEAVMRWGGLRAFWRDVFVPYAVGGALPGLACGLVSYALAVPIMRAYQRRRAGIAARRLGRARGKAGRDGVAG